MTREAVLGKISKLLALAGGEGGTEAERNLAAERAQDLLIKHRVDEYELAQARGGIGKLPGDEKRRMGRFPMGEVWRGMLMEEIGQPIGVAVVYHTELSARRYYLVGPPTSLDYVQMMHDWLAPQLRAECEAALRKEKEENGSRWEHAFNAAESAAVTIEFKRSFYEEAVDEVGYRLRLAVQKRAGGPGTALALRKADAGQFFGKIKEVAHSPYEGIGSVAGNDAGNRVDINPGNKVGSPGRRQIEE